MRNKKRKPGIKQTVNRWDGKEKLSPREYAVFMSLQNAKAKQESKQGAELRKKALGSVPPEGIVVVVKR